MHETALSLLRNPGFRRWFLGQAAFLLGNKAQGVAVAWLAYALTDSTTVLGVVAALTTLPQLALGPVGGWLADHYDERRLVMLTQGLLGALAFALAGLQAMGRLDLELLLPLALATGLVSGLDSGPRPALVQRIVGDPSQLPKAVALNALAFHVSRIAGPALAGLALSVADAWMAFLANGLMCLPLLGVLARLHPPREARPRRAPGLLRGLAYAAGHEETRTLLLGLLCMGLLASPYILLLPWFARHVFAGGASQYGLLFAASGLGSLLASLYVVLRGPAHDLTRTTLNAFALAALLIAAFAWVARILPALLLLAAAGFFFTLGAVSLNTRIQLTVPLEVRGRVLALIAMTGVGTMPLGSLLMAAAADRLGTPAAVAGGALTTALTALWLNTRRRAALT